MAHVLHDNRFIFLPNRPSAWPSQHGGEDQALGSERTACLSEPQGTCKNLLAGGTPLYINYSGFGLNLPQRNSSGPPNENFSELHIPFDVKQCSKVFLDLGSNSGVQLRKLYEGLNPQSPLGTMFSFHFDGGENGVAKNASWEEVLFDRYRDVCVIAFEPDDGHHAGLRRLAETYRSKYPEIRLAVIFAPVWINTDVMTFFRKRLSKGSSFDGMVRGVDRRIGQKNVAVQQIRAFDLVQFAQSLPLAARVLVKMDIEGAEHRVLQDLVSTAVLCHFDVVMIETHDHAMVGHRTALSNPEIMGMILRRSPCTCKTQFLDLDDETE
jgi:FkbM family methyltransferase